MTVGIGKVIRRQTSLLGSALLTGLLLGSLASAAEPVKKVLYVGIDGARFDAIESAATPHLDELIKQGTHSTACQIVNERCRESDTISGPGWSSILTGVWADKHGVMNNSFRGRNYEAYPHFFARLKQARPAVKTVSLVTWQPIHEHIVSAADVSMSYEEKAHGPLDYDRYDTAATDRGVQELATGDPDVLFLYLGQVDSAGHAKGFHPSVPDYIAAIERVDKLVGRALTAIQQRTSYAKEDWLIVVTSDHGGKGTGHGGGRDVPEIVNSFLIVSGPAAQRGAMPAPVSIVDAPATVLSHLGVKLDPKWKLDGRPVGLK